MEARYINWCTTLLRWNHNRKKGRSIRDTFEAIQLRPKYLLAEELLDFSIDDEHEGDAAKTICRQKIVTDQPSPGRQHKRSTSNVHHRDSAQRRKVKLWQQVEWFLEISNNAQTIAK